MPKVILKFALTTHMNSSKLDFLFKPGFFRVLLATTVIVGHITEYMPFGPPAVDIFFMLSGYWVFVMFEKNYAKAKHPYRTFLISRWLRIMPIYYVISILTLLVIYFIPGIFHRKIEMFTTSEQIIHDILLIGNNAQKIRLIPPAWSLAIEMQFYLIAPLCIIAIKRMHPLLIIGLAIGLHGLLPIIDDRFHFTVFPNLLYFIVGMLIANYKPVVTKAMLITSLVLLGSVIIGYEAITIAGKMVYLSPMQIAGSALVSLLSIPFVIVNLSMPSNKFDRHLGNLSYTIYLFHIIPVMVYHYLIIMHKIMPTLPGIVCYVLFCFAGSLLLYVSFELYFEKLRRTIMDKITA